MPTVLIIGSLRFHFYSDEGTEPPHIHVRTPEGECKFWIEGTVRLADAGRVSPRNQRKIAKLVVENQEHLLRSWHDFHGNR